MKVFREPRSLFYAKLIYSGLLDRQRLAFRRAAFVNAAFPSRDAAESEFSFAHISVPPQRSHDGIGGAGVAG